MQNISMIGQFGCLKWLGGYLGGQVGPPERSDGKVRGARLRSFYNEILSKILV